MALEDVGVFLSGGHGALSELGDLEVLLATLTICILCVVAFFCESCRIWIQLQSADSDSIEIRVQILHIFALLPACEIMLGGLLLPLSSVIEAHIDGFWLR